MQLSAQKISSKVSTNLSLTDEQKSVYYSSWLYTAVRNLVATDENLTIKLLSEKLNVPYEKIEQSTQFLIDIGLLKKSAIGFNYESGHTHLDSSHPLIFRHHQNWRQRAIQRMDHYTEDHLHYTCPMGISKKGAKLIRARLVEEIKKINQSLTDAPEVAFCLNIDLFEY
jgi:hypothetical protein